MKTTKTEQKSNLWINQSYQQYFNISNWHFVLWWTGETLEWPVPYITDKGHIWLLEIIMKTVLAKWTVYKSILGVSKHNSCGYQERIAMKSVLNWFHPNGCALSWSTIFKFAEDQNWVQNTLPRESAWNLEKSTWAKLPTYTIFERLHSFLC